MPLRPGNSIQLPAFGTSRILNDSAVYPKPSFLSEYSRTNSDAADILACAKADLPHRLQVVMQVFQKGPLTDCSLHTRLLRSREREHFIQWNCSVTNDKPLTQSCGNTSERSSRQLWSCLRKSHCIANLAAGAGRS